MSYKFVTSNKFEVEVQPASFFATQAERDAAELAKEAATLMAENPTAMTIKWMDTLKQLANSEGVQLIIPDRMPDHLSR